MSWISWVQNGLQLHMETQTAAAVYHNYFKNDASVLKEANLE